MINKEVVIVIVISKKLSFVCSLHFGGNGEKYFISERDE